MPPPKESAGRLLEQIQLNQMLLSLGGLAPLNREFKDLQLVKKRIRQFEGHFKPYNPGKPGFGRSGLSLTSLDGGFSGVPDLDSLKEYNHKHGTSYAEGDFRRPTAFFKACPDLRELMAPFQKSMGRSHILRLSRGGFFPPHRDSAAEASKTFRLLVSASHPDRFAFLLDGKRILLVPGQLYFFNAQLAHSVFSFEDKTDLFVFNIDLSRAAVEAAMASLAAQ